MPEMVDKQTSVDQPKEQEEANQEPFQPDLFQESYSAYKPSSVFHKGGSPISEKAKSIQKKR